MFSLTWVQPLQFFSIGLLSSFFGSMAAGAGMIAVPCLIFAGLPPTIAIGTNKIADIFRFGSAAIQFCRTGKVDFDLVKVMLPLALAGGYIGSLIVVEIDQDLLRRAVGFVLLLVPPILFVIRPRDNLGEVSTRQRISAFSFYFLMSVYGGSIQLGAGPVILLGLVHLLRLPLLVVNATSSFCWLFLTLGSLVSFVGKDFISWPSTVPLVIGSLIGGTLGARFAIRKDEQWLRIFFAISVCGLGCFLLLR